jgi:hypothetical protein
MYISTSLILAVFSLTPAVLGSWFPRSAPSSDHIIYSTVTGFFLQDDAATVPGTFDYVSFQHLLSFILLMC